MCGIFAVYNARKAAELAAIGLHGNQHRAIDYAGIASSDGEHIYRECGPGVVRKVFTSAMLDRLHGKDALGHIRYPTVLDDPTRDNIQPVLGYYGGKEFALAHNGNLTNLDELCAMFPDAKWKTSLDSELIVRLIERENSGDIEKDITKVLALLRGSATFVLLLQNQLIAVRDKSGNRPLSIGKSGESYFVSSETCAFANLGAHFVIDVPAGGMVSIKDGTHTVRQLAKPREKNCRFEAIYFTHPGSRVFEEEVTPFRIALGLELEEFAPVPGADIVTPIPDSSNLIALGYGKSGRSGEFYPVIHRNHYVGRSFIAATQAMRDLEVSQKFGFTAGLIDGKRIVVVDDSIVRGTTIPKVVRKLYELGAKEVHVRIACPPILYPCKYGINTPNGHELAAVRYDKEDFCAMVGANSLEFLPIARLRELSARNKKFCYACMDGEYWD